MFITLEGIEGSGKTTQMRTIARWLTTAGRDFLTTREPGGTPIGTQIRSVLLNPENRDLAPMAELLLYVADRVQHLETAVRPALAAGKVVVCDRYFDATLVYQGYARGLDRDTIHELHRLACGGLTPDLTLLLDLEPGAGLARAWRRIHADTAHAQESRFEKEQLDFHQRVRAGYLDLAGLQPQRFVIIDAALDETAVGVQIEAALAAHVTGRQ
ncbi:thymidylate kinase [Desulfosarcina alkanivorans]|uniref:Thymidylate kinase n=1 Tax=Desulfosarcina alkanivorans TaxID=571177 RepID=A0A5K7YVF5_9BACT|nr:dTMP kinase [Desulfosarcina alkanivorans]BBO72019.1 thymidylate kinase [Desulfosarcina alkanivorans]